MTSRLRQLTSDPKTLQADQKLAQARQALAEGRKLDARHQAWDALRADPENVKAWLMLASLASPRASVDYIQRALALRPHNPVAQRALEWAEARLVAQGASISAPAGVDVFQAVPIVEAPAAPPESDLAATMLHVPEPAASPEAPPASEVEASAEELDEQTPARGILAATLLHVPLSPAEAEEASAASEAPTPLPLGETVAEVELAESAQEAPAEQEAASPAAPEPTPSPAPDMTVAEVVLPAAESAPGPPAAAEPETPEPAPPPALDMTVAEVVLPEAGEVSAPEPPAGALPIEGDGEDESPTSPNKAVSGPRPGTHSSMTLLALAFVILVGVLAAVYFGPGTARAARPAAVAAAPLENYQKSTSPPDATATPTVTASPSPTPTFTPTPLATATPAPFEAWAGGGEARWIDVNLSLQMLTAMESDRPVDSFLVSTGLWNTPTVTGNYHVYVKYPAADMVGPGYNLPQVPYVMYFYRDYGIHGTYWHNNFGHPMSHGCVNMRTDQAGWLYNWASVGTLVHVHY